MKKFSFIGAVALVMFLVAGNTAHAAEFKSGNTYDFGSDQTVTEDLYVASQDINISGTVERGANLVGRTITISGEIKGDLQVAGDTIRISGKVDGTVRAAGSTVIITGTVGHDVFTAAAQTTIDRDAIVSGSLLTYSGVVDVNGTVTQDLRTGTGTLNVRGTVSGNAYVAANQITFSDKGTVAGSMTYTAPQKLSPQDQQKVQGMLSYNETQSRNWGKWSKEKTLGALVAAQVFARVYSTVALGLIGLLVLWLIPLIPNRAIKESENSYGRNLGYGALFFVVTPFIVVALFVTLIGIPLALLLGTLYAVVWGLTVLPIAHKVGTLLVRKESTKANKYLVFIIGLLVTELAMGILNLIPFVGPLAVFVAKLWAFGVMLLALWYMAHGVKTTKTVQTVKE